MTYETYLGFEREVLLEKMRGIMGKKRFNHVLGVEKAAIHLAEIHQYDTEKAGLAGLLHDYAKKFPEETFLDLIEKYQLDPELKKWNKSVWHGMVGIYKIKEDLNFTNEEILRAVEIHTVGAAQMTTLDKIVYVADYIEPNRNFPGVEEIRGIAEKSLDKAVAYEVSKTIAHLANKALPIFPQTLETYNAFIPYLRED